MDRNSVIAATTAGGALVSRFSVLLTGAGTQCAGGGSEDRRRLLQAAPVQRLVFAFGTVGSFGLQQHFAVKFASISIADVGVTVPAGVPVLNPGPGAVAIASPPPPKSPSPPPAPRASWAAAAAVALPLAASFTISHSYTVKACVLSGTLK